MRKVNTKIEAIRWFMDHKGKLLCADRHGNKAVVSNYEDAKKFFRGLKIDLI